MGVVRVGKRADRLLIYMKVMMFLKVANVPDPPKK